METGRNTISDPAMANLADYSEIDKLHPKLGKEHTQQPYWWEKKRLCRSDRS
jgi:hypothetical protein